MSDEREDGGPAFPRPHSMDESGDYYLPEGAQTGMSLRDWFAGQALAGVSRPIISTESEQKFCAEAARYSYVMADAMLAERGKS